MTVKVIRYGTDGDGRAILATQYAAEWLDDFADACRSFKGDGGGFTPVIVQGAYMARLPGGGAKASAGYHNGAGTYDFRTWNLTDAQKAFQMREARRRAGAAYNRDRDHGNMDEHCHLVIIGDNPAEQSSGARWQVAEYLAGRDGLASQGRDYHWRPSPLVVEWRPPAKPTPNITAALSAPTAEQRKAALRRVAAHGSPKARRQANRWLTALLAIEAGRQKASAARKALRGLEVKG